MKEIAKKWNRGKKSNAYDIERDIGNEKRVKSAKDNKYIITHSAKVKRGRISECL